MAISTYAGLVAAIGDFSARNLTKFTTNIPIFVQYAHQELNRELRIPQLQASADIVIGSDTVAMPDDFRAVARLWIDDAYDQPLAPTSPEQRLKLISERPTGRPTVFAREGEGLVFGSRPDTTYTGKLLYFAELAAMSEDADTNFILRRYPFAYLFGALSSAAAFDKNTEEEAKYEAKFRAQIGAINLRERNDAMSGGSPVPRLTGGVGL